MTAVNPEDEPDDDLAAFSEELAGQASSPWQPACVAQAWSQAGRRVGFTMQAWIELERLRSPILLGELPDELTALEAAANVFGLSVDGMQPADAIALGQALISAVQLAWSMRLKMQPANPAAHADQGFGDWLPLLACLVSQAGLSLHEARSMEVAQAFSFLAAMRHNESWNLVGGEPYNLRDINDREGAE